MIPVLPQARVSLMVLLDVPSMSLTYWDGSLHTGALTIGTVNQGTAGATAWPVKQTSTTGTETNVNGNAGSVTVLASNANRLGAAFYNDSTSAAYVKCGATASATSFTVKLGAADYWECPAGYTGIIDAIWDTGTGAMRITEFT